MADAYPFRTDGSTYVCNNCNQTIQDGAVVLGTWALGALVGARAFIKDAQVHSCGLYLQINVSLLTLDINNGTGATNG